MRVRPLGMAVRSEFGLGAWTAGWVSPRRRRGRRETSRERLVGGPLPQDRLHQGNQTSVFCEVTCASVHAFLERRLFTYGLRFCPTKCLALLLLPIGAGLSVILLWWFLSRQFYSGETQTTNYTWATSLVRRHRAVSMTHIPCFAELPCAIHHDMPSVLFSAGTLSMLKITPKNHDFC